MIWNYRQDVGRIAVYLCYISSSSEVMVDPVRQVADMM